MPETMSWKMAQYRLANRGDYPSHLLACAVAGGAGIFDLVVENRWTRISFDGAPFEERDFQELEQKTSSRRVRELAIALSAASACSEVTFRTRAGILKVSGDQVVVRTPDGTGEHANVFLVGAPLERADLDLFRRKAAHAPLTLKVNGESIPSPLEFGGSRDLLRGLWEVRGPERLRTGPLSSGKTRFFQTREEAESPSLLLCLREPSWSGGPRALVLADGLVVASESNLFGFPLLTGAVTAHHLKRDPSGQGFLQDDAYREFKEWIETEVERFLNAFCGNPPEVRSVFSRLFRLALENRYQTSERPPKINAFLENTRGLKVTRDKDTLDSVAREAVSSGSHLYLDRMQSALLFETERAVSTGEWGRAEAWNAAHLHLRSRAGRRTSPNQAAHRWLRFIQNLEVDPTWAENSLKDLSLQAPARYRAALLLYPEASWPAHHRLVDELDIPRCWTEPFKVLSPAGAPAEFESPDWDLTRDLLYGTIEEFFHRLESSDLVDRTRRAAWLELLSRTRAGHLAWKEQIKLTALRSTSWLKTPGPLKRDFYSQLEQREKAKLPPARDLRFYSFPEHRELNFPNLVHQLWLLREQHPTWQKRFLARALLVESLQGVTSERELGEVLPPRPF